MEFTASTEPFTSPLAPFLADPGQNRHIEFCEAEYQALRNGPNTSPLLWSASLLNPKNRVNSTVSWGKSVYRWRIDGCCAIGRQYFAVPVYMSPNLPVKYIDVLIPCQSQHPPALRRGLRTTEACWTPRSKIGELESSQYIAEALASWSARMPHFDEIYRHIAFGSLILLDRLSFNPRSTELRFVARTNLARHLVSIDYLMSEWDLPLSSWPPVVSVADLRLVDRLSETVSVVRLPEAISETLFVFKTNLRNINRIYHELRLLLTIPPHKNMIGEPRYIVLYDEESLSSAKVLGFILDLVPGQTLGDVLESSACISQEHKLGWSKQLVTAMIHITRSPAKFYSDLKPDNILVLRPSLEQIQIIDLEQGGNWDTFCSPEILYTSQMRRLAANDAVPASVRAKYESLLSKLLPVRDNINAKYANPTHGYYHEWTNLTQEARESAMVFAVGKVLWCIFEGSSHTVNSTTEKHTNAVDTEFPMFNHTPHRLRNLITRCTLGSPPSDLAGIKIRRKGSVVFTERREKGGWILEERPLDVLLSIRRYFECQLRTMEIHERARSRWTEHAGLSGGAQIVPAVERPTLQDVLDCLQGLELT